MNPQTTADYPTTTWLDQVSGVTAPPSQGLGTLSWAGQAPRVLALGRTETRLARLREALEPLNPQIDAVLDEEEACDLLSRTPYDLVVLHLPFGAKGNISVCRHLRASDKQVPLLVLTAAGGSDDLLACLSVGADIYIAEPIAPGELRARCAALLRRYRMTASRATAEVPAAVAASGPPPPPPSGPAPRHSAPLWGALRATSPRAGRTLAAAALVLTGILGTRIVDATQPSSATVAAAAVSAAPAAAVSTTSLDVLTERAFAAASPSVVYVSNVGVGSGSGVIYDSTGDIVTNAHVVAGAQTIRVTLSNGKTYTARLVGTDVADDLAVIHINASGLPAARFAAGGTYKVAQTVLAIGSPLGLQESVTSGLISALGRTVQESTGAYLPNAVQTSAPINPGNSGGALVTLDGTVVGIPTLEASDPQNNNGGAAQGIGFAVNSERVTYVVKQLIATGTVAHTGRAYLGVNATDAAAAAQAQSPFAGGGATVAIDGALVQQVGSGSPAEAAGVQAGDVITAVNGKSIAGESDLLSALAATKPGAPLTLTLNRNGTTLTVHVRVGEMPAS